MADPTNDPTATDLSSDADASSVTTSLLKPLRGKYGGFGDRYKSFSKSISL